MLRLNAVGRHQLAKEFSCSAHTRTSWFTRPFREQAPL